MPNTTTFSLTLNRHIVFPTVTEANVTIVWEPTWTKDMMSEAAQLQLGLI